jgi:ATPase subunit of ABC transporter with duplicated ATPase domains
MQHHLGAIGLGYVLPDCSPLFSSLTFTFNPLRTGLVGSNGIGKSTLLELLVGRKLPSSGTIARPTRVSYLGQTECFDSDATVALALGVEAELAAVERIESGVGTQAAFELPAAIWELPARIDPVFEKLGVSSISLRQPLAALSGGQLMRVRLTQWRIDSLTH